MERFRASYEIIDESYKINTSSMSEGTQIKYKKGDYYYKVNSLGNEGLVEVLCSLICQYANINHAQYWLSVINGKKGCKSKDFLKTGERIITFASLYKYRTGRDLNSDLVNCNSPDERYNLVINFTKDLPFIRSYLQKIMSLDFLTLNEDRHLRNLAVISGTSGIRECTIFDNGNSLLTCNISVNRYDTPESAVKKICSKPFSGSPSKQLRLVGGNCLSIDYVGLLLELQNLKENHREVEILKYQLQQYRSMYWKRKFYALYYNGRCIGTRILSKSGDTVVKYDTGVVLKSCGNLSRLNMIKKDNIYIVKGDGNDIKEVSLSNEMLNILGLEYT